MRSQSTPSAHANKASRAKSSAEPADEFAEPAKDAGKGKPTPKRREAEAARKARVKPALTKREQFKRDRERTKRDRALGRGDRDQRRQGIERGDEKYLMKRDQGPVRKFVRDYVDSRRFFAEFFLPVILLILLLGFVRPLAVFSTMLMVATMFLIIFDLVMLRFRLKRELSRRFPDDEKRHTLYAFSRATQLRRLRIPKPTVKPGDPV